MKGIVASSNLRRRASRATAALCAMLLVGSCGGQQYVKRADWREQAALAMPPAELWQFAGKSAAAEIDYETLIGPDTVDPAIAAAEGADDTLVATSEEPDQTQEPQEEAAATQDENAEEPAPKAGALVIKAVAVPRVRGSPGNGNTELTEAMRRTLREAGVPVLDAPRKDAITIAGAVKLGPARGATQKVGVNWTVSAPDGNILGAIKQSNDIPAGSLDQGWGDAAFYATEAAATGIFGLIEKFR